MCYVTWCIQKMCLMFFFFFYNDVLRCSYNNFGRSVRELELDFLGKRHVVLFTWWQYDVECLSFLLQLHYVTLLKILIENVTCIDCVILNLLWRVDSVALQESDKHHSCPGRKSLEKNFREGAQRVPKSRFFEISSCHPLTPKINKNLENL